MILSIIVISTSINLHLTSARRVNEYRAAIRSEVFDLGPTREPSSAESGFLE